MLRLFCKHVAAQLHSASLQHSLPSLPISSPQHCHASMTTVRMASSKRHKKNPDLKGYDFILHQWKRGQASGSKRTSSTAAKGHKQHAGSIWCTDAHLGSHSSSSSSSSKRRNSSRSSRRQQLKPGSFQWRGSYKSTWADADLAAAAAAAQLHPDEYYNLVFGLDDIDDSSSSSTGSRKERRKTGRAKRRARRMQQTAKAWGYAESTWTDSDAESDDEWQQQQQQYGYGNGRPDWQWWDDQQEREWFEQAWRQSGGQQGWQQQQQQQSQSQHGSSNGSGSFGSSTSSGRPWWDSFQQGYQQQQQQHREQQQQQQTFQHRSRQRNWQQAGCAVRHPPSVLAHLAVLDLPSDAVLQRAQLKAAFHKAAMRWHPDMHVGDSHKAAAEVKFKQVKEAYENLVLRAAV